MASGNFVSVKQDFWVSFTANFLIRKIQEHLTQKENINIAISGGTTPLAVFNEWAKDSKLVDWERVRFFWVDERYVPINDKQSNFGNAFKYLSALTGAMCYPMIGSEILEDIPQIVLNYTAILKQNVNINKGFPCFDMICLGMGNDGHYASLFPGTKALEATTEWVMENWVAEHQQFRISLTDPVIQNAEEVLVLVNDVSKNPLLAQLFFRETDYPIQRVMNRKQSTTWIYSI